MATSQTSAGFAGRAVPGEPGPGAPRTASARAASRLSASRSPTMAWCAAARPSVSVTPATAPKACPAVSSSKYGPSALMRPRLSGGPPGPSGGTVLPVAPSGRLEHGRDALAAADAHRLQRVPAAAPLEFVQHRGQDAGARRPDRVAEGDARAVHVQSAVELVELGAPALQHAQHLHRERLVQLDQVQVVEPEPEPPEQLGDGRHRSEAHRGGLAPDRGPPGQER